MTWIWLLFIVGGWAVGIWRWRQKRVQAEWPSASGRIEKAFVNDNETKVLGLTLGKKQNQFLALITYSYSVGGGAFGGTFKKEFGSSIEAEEFVRDLDGKSIEVQYSPTKPAKSALTEQAIETVQQARGPAPPQAVEAVIPQWLRPVLWLLVAGALVGFLLSVWVHLRSIRGDKIPEGFMALHVGIFVVWFPAVLAAVRLGKGGQGKDLWKRVLRGAPWWARYAFYGLFGYSWLTMVFSSLANPAGRKSGVDSAGFRSFSAAWMLFYCTAAAILYSAARIDSLMDHCLGGHAVIGAAQFCPKCGQPVSHAPSSQHFQ